jgi:hypothetical protein
VTFPVTVLSPPDLYNGSRENKKETAMKDKSLSAARAVAAAAAVTAVAMLTTACGVHVHFGNSASPASTPTVTYPQELALAQCMRGHGEPNFPDPDPSGGFNASVVSTFDNSQGQAAYGACRHLLAGGGPSLTQLERDLQQQQQREQKALPVLLKFSQCMRGHGVPGYPDPTLTSQGISENLKSAGIDVDSTQFKAAVTACQHELPAGSDLNVSVHGSFHTS